MLPRAIADRLVRAAGKGERFGCRYLSFRQLRRACGRFVVHRYTARVLQDPGRFQFTRLAKLAPVTRRVPLRWLEAVEPLSPNFVWVLEKPRR